MGYIDLHESPFDETTIAKLEIFEDYAQAWIPTFVMQDYISEIHIFDFFAGTGYDNSGVPGSPIRILTKVQEQKGHLFQKNMKVIIYLNEYEPNKKAQKKFEQLKNSCKEFMSNDSNLEKRVEVKYYNEDFEVLFPKLLGEIRRCPSLVYLDQNGIKYLSDTYLLELEKTSKTDFLFFVSSSYFWRFGDSKEFKNHLELDLDLAKKQGYKKIHRTLTDELRKNLPNNTKLKLYPFSLKKGPNIHGIIFGAAHPRAVDKFLKIGWKRNGDNGDANFDIDDAVDLQQLDIFAPKKLNKIESFAKDVETHIMNRSITSNKELLNFTYEAGHIPKHAADCLKKLKKEGLVDYDGRSPLVTYENVHKTGKIISYRLKG